MICKRLDAAMVGGLERAQGDRQVAARGQGRRRGDFGTQGWKLHNLHTDGCR
jgi:hypothetical protein